VVSTTVVKKMLYIHFLYGGRLTRGGGGAPSGLPVEPERDDAAGRRRARHAPAGCLRSARPVRGGRLAFPCGSFG